MHYTSEIFIGKNNFEWKSTPLVTSKIRSFNIIKTPLSKVVLPPQKTINKIEESFSLLMAENIINDIVKFTNQEVERVHRLKNKDSVWRPCDEIELQAS